ncbi:hypothetical protein GF359_06130 [candidate division WOR-3 bacterium]|uniref:TolB protein n=1 Tax=candidate division WOR-3 bacterium TaxID=2052148 RepID=A0A9D5K9B9_UNCW3|nr:hypothetical protein [candidate division WOR-3 bacterium]MBD3364777.1 hypothetical protein [candidate division WOR-3 bacterium]
MKRVHIILSLVFILASIAGCGPSLPEGLVGEIAYISPVDDDGAHDIYILKLPSMEERRITKTAGNNVENVWIDWSTTGLLAYGSNREASRDYEIFIVDAKGKYEEQLTKNDHFDGYPTFSPSGKLLAYSSERPLEDSDERPQRDIYVADLKTGGEDRVTETPGSELDLSWSPDGSRIAFSKSVMGFFQIFVYEIQTEETIQLTDVSGSNNRSPEWTPDAQRIVFTSNRDDTENAGIKRRNSIYIMNADGSEQKGLLKDDILSYNGPEVSPDGKWLLYSVVATDWPEGENIMLRALDSEDGKNYKIMKNEYFNRTGTWNPLGVTK